MVNINLLCLIIMLGELYLYIYIIYHEKDFNANQLTSDSSDVVAHSGHVHGSKYIEVKPHMYIQPQN